MFRYFDKTFFRFAGGFLAIIFVSIIIFLVASYERQKMDQAAAVELIKID